MKASTSNMDFGALTVLNPYLGVPIICVLH